MNQNLELLEYIYQNAEMGVHTLTKLIKDLDGRENKIKKDVEEQLKGYEYYLEESKKLLEKNNVPLKGNSLMTKMMSAIGIDKEVTHDNSDASIAHMLIEGINMGIVDITSKIDNYEGSANDDNIDLAKKILKFQQEQLEIIKKYL